MDGERFLPDEAATRALGAELGATLRVGDIVFLHGELGAGKTTLVRGLLESLGVTDPVRSPTFNLLQVFPTQPPILHADLYRLRGYQGLGMEDYLATHALLIEWPDRAEGLAPEETCWHVFLEPADGGRKARVLPPTVN